MYADNAKAAARAPLTVPGLRKMKADRERIAALTAYDASFARALDAAGVDLVLVGDSLGMVVQGHTSTLPVSVDDIVYHTACVARGLHAALLVADMPFQSYATPERALDAATRMLAQGGASMVKLEGAGPDCDGQILVLHDMLGLNSGHRRPRFVRDFLKDGKGSIADALEAYVKAVKAREFPTAEHGYQ
jgi:ketopantoate hydroxymethyltransferase